MKDEEKRCECGSKRIMETPDEVWCKKCGLVMDDSPIDFADRGGERDENGVIISRTGAPSTYLSGFKGMLPPTDVGSKKDLYSKKRSR